MSYVRRQPRSGSAPNRHAPAPTRGGNRMRFPAARRARGARRGLAAASAALLLASGTVALTQAAAGAAAGCRVDYTVNDWGGGFTATVSVTNLGDPITGGWTPEWDFDGSLAERRVWYVGDWELAPQT